ncbi:glycosyltransferase [Nocardioides houyundeii]|uniref:glycosyltransferase n=1 Tax=Nocardioides houyundeii TaxID=2045452 RepID=UPI0018F01823|nr:glycosyltransferase [Nocardioides houyundeii]
MTHVVVVADSRYPIGEPFAGGMQSMTWHLVRGLRARGTRVTVFAGPGSDPELDAHLLDVRPVELSETARRDVSMGPQEWVEQHHAYLQLMLALARRDDVDVVHNNTLHHLPVAMADLLPCPMVTTLHTPPTPWLEPVVRLADARHTHFAAVSRYTATQWSHVTQPAVVLNGVDTDRWPLGPGGDDLLWSGRIVPEKGTHLALDIAAAAGRRLLLAGPIADPGYWRDLVQPRLGPDAVYLGHLHQQALAEVAGRSAAVLVTPLWDEPYGLVGAEAISCGTPVVGFDRGGMAEVLDRGCARLVAPGDVAAAAAAVAEVVELSREEVRRGAETSCSVGAMVERYLSLYDQLGLRHAA